MGTRIHAAEFVLPGHPDKLCDAIADALVDEASRRERRALCGVEVALHRSSVFVTGRLACRDAHAIDVAAVVREVYRSAGYGDGWPPAPEDLRIEADLCLAPLNDGEAEFRSVSDDQSIVTGYAVDLPGTNYLPLEHWLAARLARGLERMRREAPGLGLGPDGKVAVLLEDEDRRSRLAAVSASLQQAPSASAVELLRAVRAVLRQELEAAARVIPGLAPDFPEDLSVNGAGDFVVGGPQGDNGLSGKKLVVDAYGPRVPIGGGALSGKDLYKADRAGAIIARRLAKAVVLTGAAPECLATLVFFPGATDARIVSLVGRDGGPLATARWAALLDRSLGGLGDRYTGCVPLREVARYGHFIDPDRPWERLTFDGGSPATSSGAGEPPAASSERRGRGPDSRREMLTRRGRALDSAAGPGLQYPLS